MGLPDRVRQAGARLSSGTAASIVVALQVLLAPAVNPQAATQQRVYVSASVTTTTSILPAYNKDSATGVLSLLPNAPFADRLEGGALAIDGQGRFLFVLNPESNSISMFQIDASTGALSEVPNSPFAAGPTVNPNLAPSLPVSLAAEKSGNYLYVGYANGDSSTTSAVVPFAIDAASLRLVLTPQLALDFGSGAPIQMAADGKGLHLYVELGPGGNQGSSSAGTLVFAIDPANGVLTQTGNAGDGADFGRAIAMDPQGRFFFDGWGQSQGFLDSGVISPVDGTSNVSFTVDLGQNVFPSTLLVDGSGKFLYVQTGPGLLIYAIDGTTGALTLLDGPLSQFNFAKGKTAVDTMGPYLYSLDRSGVEAFQIDAQSGALVEISGAPFSIGSSAATGSLGLAITGSAVQSVSGPAAQIFPSSLDLGQVPMGQTSATKIVSIVNVGDQPLAIIGISIAGANSGDFAQSNACAAVLAPNVDCSVSILFTPSQAGIERASLQISDNAAGSPQTAPLTGTGLIAQGSVTLAPGSVDFGTLAQSAVTTRNVQLTNSGSGALHVSGIALSGSNPGDFSETNTCTGVAIAAQTSCLISVSFVPQTEGRRTASLVITDDGAGSPQSVVLSGSGVTAFQLSAQGATSATINAGQTAQYALVASPGPGFAGSISLQCNGAPSGARCNVSPAAITFDATNPQTFQVSVATTSGASLLPSDVSSPELWTSPFIAAFMAVACLIFLRWKRGTKCGHRAHAQIAATAVACGVLLLAAGCGSANSSPARLTRAGTPRGTTLLSVVATSGTLPQQSIQLTLTVN